MAYRHEPLHHLHDPVVPPGSDIIARNGDTTRSQASVQDVNADRVKEDIQHRPQHQGRHGKARTAVEADDGIHGLAEHVKRDAQRNPEKILLGEPEGLIVDPGSKSGQNWLLKGQINRHERKADHNHRNNGCADCPGERRPAPLRRGGC